MIELLRSELDGKKILLLGFGKEGRSSYLLIRKILPHLHLVIADADESIKGNPVVAGDPEVSFHLGPHYLEQLDRFDLVIKSPGITLKDISYPLPKEKITSQTDLFLKSYSGQVIGITGTKGKSTTSTLLNYILKKAEKDSILLGNIGRPAFDCIEDIRSDTSVIYELSSHQLEYISRAPHIAVVLNLFQEHLDAYHSFRDYQLAKMNITRYQQERDYFIFNADDQLLTGLINESRYIRNYFPFSFETELSDGSFVKDGSVFYSEDSRSEPVIDLGKKRKLKGDHNVKNIMAVINVCRILGIGNEIIREGVAGFTGLEHRMEYAGHFHGIFFYNDSIATIPEATIEAMKTLENVDTLILGGFDRGIDYSGLALFLAGSGARNFILTGEAGRRIGEVFAKFKRQDQTIFRIDRFDEFQPIAFEVTRPGAICLLSPAASSYDEFPNFEFRGRRFKELIQATGD